MRLRPEHFPVTGLQILSGRSFAAGQGVGNGVALQEGQQTLLPVWGTVPTTLQPREILSRLRRCRSPPAEDRERTAAQGGAWTIRSLKALQCRASRAAMGRGTYDYLPLPSLFVLGGIFIVENGKQKGIYFKASERELDLIKQKMALAGVRNMSGYLRKMAIDGYVINLELPELAEGVKLLRYISNNVNQMARTMNSGGAVYPDEVNDICTKQDETNRLFGAILEQLAKVK